MPNKPPPPRVLMSCRAALATGVRCALAQSSEFEDIGIMHRQIPPRRQRIAVLGTVTILHAAMLALFLAQRHASQPPVVSSDAIALVAVNAEQPAAAKPPPPMLPAKKADTFKPVIEFSLPAEIESDAPSGATGACSPERAVLDALLADANARDAIREAPQEARSVSDAILIWNGAWNPVLIDVSTPLYRVRYIVERTLQRLTPACLDQPVTGPRLLPLPEADGVRTSFIVIGSGVWTWRTLLELPPLAGTADPDPASVPIPPTPQ